MKKYIIVFILLIVSCNGAIKRDKEDQLDWSNIIFQSTENNFTNYFEKLFIDNVAGRERNTIDSRLNSKYVRLGAIYTGYLRFNTFLDHGIEEVIKEDNNPVFNQHNFEKQSKFFLSELKISEEESKYYNELFDRSYVHFCSFTVSLRPRAS